MNENNINLFLLVILVFSLALNPFSACRVNAQDERAVIEISERVGDTITIDDRNYFNLFPDINGFQSAVFLRQSDGSLLIEITYRENEQELKKIQEISEPEMRRIGEYIDHYEEIQDGKLDFPYSTTIPLYQPEILAEKPPPLRPALVAGELAVGTLGALGGGLIGIKTGLLIIGDDDWEKNLTSVAIGYFVGSTLVSSAGVYLVGVLNNEYGSFGLTYLGSALGLFIGAMVVVAIPPIDDEEFIDSRFILTTLFQSAGATLIFNQSREGHMPDEALLNYREGKWNLSHSYIQYRANPLQKGEMMLSVNLLGLSF